jgi:hypothetical protein
MRITTILTRLRVALTLAVLITVPYESFAQLPFESREIKLQGSAAGSLSIVAPSTVTTPYTITLPNAVGSNGSLLYSNTTTGGLTWTGAPGGTGYSLRWNGTAIEWVDPAGADNPNWSLTGNALGAPGVLGSSTNQGISIITNNLERMSITGSGVIGINDGTNAGATTNIGKDGNTVNLLGTSNLTGATNINTSTGTFATNIGTGTTAGTVTIGRTGGTITTVGTLGHTGDVNMTGDLDVTGNVNLVGTTRELQMNGAAGSNGNVLVSKGTGATPEWQSINSAIGIRSAALVSTGGSVTSYSVTGLTTLTATDAILVTLEGGTSVTATVTSRTAGTGFTVTFSGAYSGNFNYMVLAAQ